MSFVKDTFFGGAEEEAARVQVAGLERGQAAVEAGIAQARGEAIPLFQSAQQAGQQGFQGALDVFGQTIPGQLQAQQAGNVGAQQALLAGLSPQMAAILGGNIDLSGLQPQTLPVGDLSFAQQQLPQFGDINQALGINQQPPQQVAPPEATLQQLLGFGGGGFGSQRFGPGGTGFGFGGVGRPRNIA